MTLAAPPADAWPAIARCLTGYSLFDLARVNRWNWHLLSQDDYWRGRLTVEDTRSGRNDGITTALKMYMRAYSFQFQELPKEDPGHPAPLGSCAELSSFDVSVIQQRHPFAFDVWFCLLDGSDGTHDTAINNAVYVGGILFGAQSVSYDDDEQADNQLQFAVVSSHRKLLCSVVSEMAEIASNLELHRWYHLALTYADQTQRVYLDGQLMSTVVGRLHREWWDLSYAQVGTGSIVADGMQFPEPDSCGWYPFNGLIDNFRLWKRELSSDDVHALAHGSSFGLAEGESHYSLRRSYEYVTPKKARRVGCSRPKEKVVELRSRSES